MFRWFALLTLVLGFASQAPASVILSFGSVNWTEGGPPASVDVFITAESGFSYDLIGVGLELQIESVVGTNLGGSVDFLHTQDFTSLLADPAYVFFGQINGIGSPSFSSPAMLLGSYSDALADPGFKTIDDQNTFLLTRLQLVDSTPLQAGESFTISVVDTSSFLYDPILAAEAPYNLASTTFTVQSAPVGVIPEPCSAVTAVLLAGCGYLRLRRKEK